MAHNRMTRVVICTVAVAATALREMKLELISAAAAAAAAGVVVTAAIDRMRAFAGITPIARDTCSHGDRGSFHGRRTS